MVDVIPFQTAQQRDAARRAPTGGWSGRVLVVARDGRFRDRLIADASVAGFEVSVATDLRAAARCLSHDEIDVCLVDLDEVGEGLCAFCRSSSGWRGPTTLVGVASAEMLASATLEIPVEWEVLPKSCPPGRLRGRLADAVERQRLKGENVRLRNRTHRRLQDELVGVSKAAESLRQEIHTAANNDDPLLVTGEPGSGKTLVARAVHLSGSRSEGPLISVDCGLRTSACIEQELFGESQDGRDELRAGGESQTGPRGQPYGWLPSDNRHRPDHHSTNRTNLRSVPSLSGSVIGADRGAFGSGRLAHAVGGTLVLENIDQATCQLATAVAKFFRRQRQLHGVDKTSDQNSAPHSQNPVLRGGGIRLIAVVDSPASGSEERDRPEFDLLSLFGRQTILVSPLRERREDIVPLAEHFLHRLAVREGRPVGRLTADARRLLESVAWPGNVRQLCNVIGRAASLEPGALLTADVLRPWLEEVTPWDAADDAAFAHDMTIKQMERKLIEATFNRYGGNRERTAQALRIGLRTLSGKLREYGYPPRGGPGSNLQREQRKAA